MTIYLTPKDKPFELDATGTQNTPELPIGDNLIATVQAKDLSGSGWVSAAISVRVSNNGLDFFDIPGGAVTLSDDGITDIIDIAGWAYIRVEVTTTNAGAPTIAVWLRLSTERRDAA